MTDKEIYRMGKGKVMSKNINSGSSLSQYAIILALVAIVLIPGFFLVGGSISESFSNFLSALKDNKGSNSQSSSQIVSNNSNQSSTNNSQSSSNTSTVYKQGELGGSPENPVKKCENSTCTIDFGEFVLNGIPQDMNDYLMSSGASGTTMLLADIVEQITINSKNIDTSVDIDLLKKLANKGHGIADLEKQLEDNATDFLKDTDQMVSTDFVVPGGFLDGSTDVTFFDLYLDQINDQLKNPVTQSDKNIKEIVNLLGGEIRLLSDTMSDYASDVGSGINVPVEKVEKILKPQASIITNLDSSIICVTGNNQSQNNTCK